MLAGVALSADDESTSNALLPLDHWANEPIANKNLTLLDLSVQDDTKSEFAKLLLRSGARADSYNDQVGTTPLHRAVLHKNYPAMELLCHFDPRNASDVNVLDRAGQSCLHIAAQNDDLRAASFLLNHSDFRIIDGEDLNGRRTALYIAIKNKFTEMTKLLISKGASLNNVVFGKSLRDLCRENLPNLNVDSIPVQSPVINATENDTDEVYCLNRILDKAQLIKRKKECLAQLHIQFMMIIQKNTAKNLESVNLHGMTLVQKAANYGLHLFVESLLDLGMNPNSNTVETPSKPVLLAAYNGHGAVLKVLVDHKLNNYKNNDVQTTDFTALEISGGESALHWLLKKPNRESSDNPDYEEALDILLGSDLGRDIVKVINTKDNLGNSPLHYATQLWSQKVVRSLMEMGANIGLKNIWGETPIAKILPETMESYLDEYCLNAKHDVTNEDFALTFNYSFLAPPLPFNEDDKVQPETESLWYMSQSKAHRALLRHPVITSFLWLKWQRIRGYFNRNLRFYFLFVVCLTWYIFERFGGISSRMSINTNINNSSANSYCSNLSERKVASNGFWFYVFLLHSFIQLILLIRDIRKDLSEGRNICRILSTSWLEYGTITVIITVIYYQSLSLYYVITGLLILLILREMFQLSVSLKRYIFTLENWLEIFMIILAAIILFVPDEKFANPCDVKRHLAAISILLSWSEMITLVARHPRLSRYNIYVTMFYKVLKTFFFFLVWYSFFVIAFGLGFYIMLHKDIPGYDVTDDDYTFFNYPWLTLIKTSTMFVGEIEFADIPIDIESKMSPVGYLFLLAFVFLILVVLMNLLNGLAVSDTGIIRDKAEIVSFISRVETISYTESLLLGDPFDFLANWPAFQWLKSLPSVAVCRTLFRNETIRDVSHKITGATGILLFYSTLPDKTLTLTPNSNLNVDCCSRILALKEMDPNVIRSAKNKITIMRDKEKSEHEQKNMEKVILNLQEQVSHLNGKIDFLMTKLVK